MLETVQRLARARGVLGVHGEAEQQRVQQHLGPLGEVRPPRDDAGVGPAQRQRVDDHHGGGPLDRAPERHEVEHRGRGGGVCGAFCSPFTAPVSSFLNRRGSLTIAASSGALSGTLMTSIRHCDGFGLVAGPGSQVAMSSVWPIWLDVPET